MTYTERRWIGTEACPNGPTIHVTPVTISSSAPLISLETPGNITAAEACPYCHPTPSSGTSPREEGDDE